MPILRYIVKRLGIYISIDDFELLNTLIEDVSRLLNAYGRKIKETSFAEEI